MADPIGLAKGTPTVTPAQCRIFRHFPSYSYVEFGSTENDLAYPMTFRGRDRRAAPQADPALYLRAWSELRQLLW